MSDPFTTDADRRFFDSQDAADPTPAHPVMKRFYFVARCNETGDDVSLIVDAYSRDQAREIFDAKIVEIEWVYHKENASVAAIWELPEISSIPKALIWGSGISSVD